jgi:hypothetical protein
LSQHDWSPNECPNLIKLIELDRRLTERDIVNLSIISDLLVASEARSVERGLLLTDKIDSMTIKVDDLFSIKTTVSHLVRFIVGVITTLGTGTAIFTLFK